MIDLHTHTLLSDGDLLPSELVQRASVKGYTAIALTDHADMSNIEQVVKGLSEAACALNRLGAVRVIPGVEITHTPPAGIKGLVDAARKLGAALVLVHGETISEPVARGTNRAAIEAGADILAHPGLISKDDADKAGEKGVYLEISARNGHSLSNGHVAKVALCSRAGLVFSTDTHTPEDLVTDEERRIILSACGLNKADINIIIKNAEQIAARYSAGNKGARL